MFTVYTIAAEADTSFLRQQVLPFLPSQGYSHWLAGFHMDKMSGRGTIENGINECAAVIIIVSSQLLRSPAFDEINIAINNRKINLVIVVEAAIDQSLFPESLWQLPVLDASIVMQTGMESFLLSLLPSAAGNLTTPVPGKALPIDWNEEVFSKLLANATASHDHPKTEWLVSNLHHHVSQFSRVYSSGAAIEDMTALRRVREFRLMVRYAEVVLDTGTKKDILLKLYAQALIETGRYEKAKDVLHAIIVDAESSKEEIFEAKGLVGRIYKQLYMDNPSADPSASLLWQAVDAYGSAFLEDNNNVWHGVNTVSLLQRLERDGYDTADFAMPAKAIAALILQHLNELSAAAPLPVWDCASRVEALIALESYREAEAALEIYIHHQGMTAFEVSSTYRQFRQVLQLDRTAPGAALLDRLRYTMERYRAGTVFTHTNFGGKPEKDETVLKSLVIRLSDAYWEPADIPGLIIESRLDKIVTARGFNQSVRKLLDDPLVVSVEASRPAGNIECSKSLPFINVCNEYHAATGNYQEAGGLTLVAIIDDSIDVLHEAFLDGNGHSRIIGVWDQTDQSGAAPMRFSYGTFYHKEAIDDFVLAQSVPHGLDPKGLRHGTHVASIAAGKAVGSFAGGMAPDAKIVVVISNNNGATGYSNSYIDALAFIDEFASNLGLPVVVNVSQGMNAGAHDGKSALEAAFDNFSGSGRTWGRVVVKSAGNERDKAGHAFITLLTGGAEQLVWHRPKGAGFTERIELWWSSSNEMRFRLRSPIILDQGKAEPLFDWSNWVGTANPECAGDFPNGGGPYRLSYVKRHVDNGDSLLVIELGRTTMPPAAAGSGEWLLEIEAFEVKQGNGAIHCWIERGGGVASSFQLPHVSTGFTLSIPGTASTVITVGAVDASRPIRVGRFSSHGPTRDNAEKPQVCAPGVNVIAAEAGTSTGAYAASGTSMAAPHVAGAIALLLSRAARRGIMLNANQISKAICQKTQNYSGTWEPGQGYGVIDVAALLAAFE